MQDWLGGRIIQQWTGWHGLGIECWSWQDLAMLCPFPLVLWRCFCKIGGVSWVVLAEMAMLVDSCETIGAMNSLEKTIRRTKNISISPQTKTRQLAIAWQLGDAAPLGAE